MEWNKEKVSALVQKQREYFKTNETLSVSFRIKQLKKIKEAIKRNEQNIIDALKKDLNRAPFESYFCDIGDILYELNETIHGLKKWAKPETRRSGLIAFPSTTTKVYKMPYGVSLIISPFNFPFMLSLGVLVCAIAGGNTAVIKASSKSKYSTECLIKIVSETFEEKYVAVVDGGHDIADFCLEERFDKIFYTGSPNVAKHVMEEASHNLTPVALELGGETGNYCVVRKDANLKDAARKIAFFKLCNAGQICININQVAVAKEVADEFVDLLKQEFKRQIGDALNNEEYPKLIGEKAYKSCESWVNRYQKNVVFGGKGDPASLKFEPTILYPIDINEDIVNTELFAPLLPIIVYEDSKIDDLLKIINNREHGLALYLFTKDIKWAKKVMQTSQYGGGCINEVCLHFLVKGVPFNGTGHSGLGAYHGEWGFREFTHPSTVLFGKTHFNLPLREHPYTDKKLNLIKKILK